MAICVDEVGPHLAVVRSLQDLGIQKARLRHERQIGTVQFPVPLDLREREIVRLKGQEPQAPIPAREEFDEAIFVGVWIGGQNRHKICDLALSEVFRGETA